MPKSCKRCVHFRQKDVHWGRCIAPLPAHIYYNNPTPDNSISMAWEGIGYADECELYEEAQGAKPK